MAKIKYSEQQKNHKLDRYIEEYQDFLDMVEEMKENGNK